MGYDLDDDPDRDCDRDDDDEGDSDDGGDGGVGDRLRPEASTVVVHTPARAICVEPQTAWPNAVALPRAAAERAGVRFLEAGERLASTMTLRWRAAPVQG